MSKNRKVTRKTPAKKAKSAKVNKIHRARKSATGDSRNPEIVGIIALGVAIFVVAALLSLQVGGGRFMGPFGRTIASGVYGLAGMCSYLLAGVLAVVAVRLLIDRTPIAKHTELLAGALALLSLATLIHLIGGSYRVAGHAAGGLVGEHLAEVLRAVISTAGTVLVALVGLVCAVVIATPLRMRQIFGGLRWAGSWAWAGARRAGSHTARFCGEVVRAVLPERDHDEYLDRDAAFLEEDDEYDAYDLDDTSDPAFVDPPIIDTRSGAVPMVEMDGDTEKIDDEELAARIEALQQAEAAAAMDERSKKKDAKKKDAKKGAKKKGAKKAATKKPTIEVIEPAPADVATDSDGPMIVASKFTQVDEQEMRAREEQADAKRLDFIPLGDGEYQLPPIHLLDYDAVEESNLDHDAMLELSARLTQTLDHYGVKGEVVAIRPGPVVTMYEFAPAPGTRINKIVNLSDDLAMSLEALKVRIVAPIPGKAAVGIEVPNRDKETVYLKEILADKKFQDNKFHLPVALGKDIEGGPQVVDLSKMPHLLVAGTTGSGKSVAVNSMITSLLYHCTPDEVRMIMIDPKMLELSIYEGVPHLLLPVVTDPKKANLALRWAVEEMERRYDLLATAGVRDLSSYNKRLDKTRAKWEADRLRRAADEAERLADEGVEITQEREPDAHANQEPPKALPYIVVIIDEFADLMMCAPKEVETSVARIAQKARAAGIHIVLATQRPSVNVITGLIKANFPSRAAFRVTAKVDSRTVLDQSGAEALLGAGDMLFSDRGAAPVRLHGCFVSEDEIHRVVEFLKTQGKPVYNLDIIKPRTEDVGGKKLKDEPVDEMYDHAVALISETRQVSISMIQRKLRIGYNRAARIVEHMEREGVVSPPDGTNRREVLIAEAA